MKPVTYLSNLTPLRGIAALLTVIFYVGLMVTPLVSNSNLFNRMYLMVEFFFVHSGFIMCHVYCNLFSAAVTMTAMQQWHYLLHQIPSLHC